MITDPYSNLLTAYPHQCYKLGTIPANTTAFATPQFWTSQVVLLAQASWNLHIIAVWNTAARLWLKSHNPTWLQNLARDIPDAHWYLNRIANDPMRNTRHAETVTGPKKFEKHSLRQNSNYQVPPQTYFG